MGRSPPAPRQKTKEAPGNPGASSNLVAGLDVFFHRFLNRSFRTIATTVTIELIYGDFVDRAHQLFGKAFDEFFLRTHLPILVFGLEPL